MGLIIPTDVGGRDDVPMGAMPPPAPSPSVAKQGLIIPADVGGDAPIEQKQPAQPQEEAGFFDLFTGASKETPETRSLPELGGVASPVTTGEFGKDIKIAAGLLASVHPKDQMDVIQSADPDASFREDEKGNVIVKLGNGQEALLNAPGMSFQDITTSVAQVLSFIPAAKMASLGKSLMQKVGIGAMGAGATQAGLQEVETALGAEEARRPGEIVTAGVLGGAAEAVMPAIQAVRGARQAAKIGAAGEEVEQVAKAVTDATEAQRGLAAATSGKEVPLFQAQKTAVPATLEKQAFVGQLPAGTQKANAALKGQNKAIGDTVDDFLGLIAPDSSIVTGAEKFRTASQRAIKAVARIRSEASSPIYKQAFRRQRQGKVGTIKTDALEVKLDNIIKQFDESDQVASNLRKVLDKVQKAEGNLQKLHVSKTEIDQIIEGRGVDAIGKTTKRFLVDAQRDLVEEMTKQSPSYRAARSEFIRTSPPVATMQESIIGKMADIDDTQLKSIARRIFDPAETNPKVIRQAKKVIDDVDPDAWNQLLRTELERRMGTVAADITETTAENVPGQLHRAIFGNAKQRAVLFNAVDGEMAKNMKYLETVLKRAKLGRPGGSQTAAREEIKAELRGGSVQAVRDFFRKPISSVISTGEDAAFNRRVRALADALFDPQWKPQVAKLRKLDPNSSAADRAMTQLLNDAEDAQEEEE